MTAAQDNVGHGGLEFERKAQLETFAGKVLHEEGRWARYTTAA